MCNVPTFKWLCLFFFSILFSLISSSFCCTLVFRKTFFFGVFLFALSWFLLIPLGLTIVFSFCFSFVPFHLILSFSIFFRFHKKFSVLLFFGRVCFCFSSCFLFLSFFLSFIALLSFHHLLDKLWLKTCHVGLDWPTVANQQVFYIRMKKQ